jgi:hypothetical protein
MKMPKTLVATVGATKWEIDPTLLRPEHRLDRFDGARHIAGTVADAVARLHQNRCAAHEPDRMFQTGSDAGTQANTLIGVNDRMERQGLCGP